MTSHEDLGSIATLTVTDDRARTLLSQAWLSPILQPRIFLPVANQRTQEYCLRFFITGRWKRNLCRVALLFERWTGTSLLATKSTVTDFDQHVTAVLPAVELFCPAMPYHIAFLVGRPGPYQKIAALIVLAHDATKTFFKSAAHETADNVITSEARWLTKLTAFPAVRGHIPELLGVGHLPNGRAYILTTASPTLKTVPQFVHLHERFLSELGRATSVWCRYGESEEALRIQGMLSSLSDVLGPAIHADLNAGWDAAFNALADWKGPLVIAHRDFAPWNMRWSQSGIFVFDWEYAVEQANPLHDFYHFHLVQIALSKFKRVNTASLLRVMRKAQNYAHLTYPNAQWDESVISALLLTYLLEVVLFYTDSGQFFDPRHPILSSYHSLICIHARWLPK